MCFAIEWFWVGIEGDKAKVNSFITKNIYIRRQIVCLLSRNIR